MPRSACGRVVGHVVGHGRVVRYVVGHVVRHVVGHVVRHAHVQTELDAASKECAALKQQLADEQERRRQEHEAAVAQLKKEHDEAAAQLHAEHEQQLQKLHALTESAGGAEKAALEQLEEARKECGALQEQVGP